MNRARYAVAAGMTVLCAGVSRVGVAQQVAVGDRSESTATLRTASHISAAVRGRLVTLDITKISLERALDMVGASAGIRISYNTALLDTYATPVSVRVTRAPLGDVLDRLLAGTPLTVTEVPGGMLAVVKRQDAPVPYSEVRGRVIDLTTKHPIRGATVTIDDAAHGVLTADDGTFRIPNVAPGAHTIRIRLLGYVKTSKSVTIVEGQTTSIEIALEPSINALDQVVVTGTVIPTELKAVPSAMTVISGQELEQRGITHIDQLFHGEIPGVWSAETGTSSLQPGQITQMTSRGANSLGGYLGDVGIAGQTTRAIKTYVDGVELADPTYLGLIDPRSIDRIEIITGPQASTIYGTNAINGVMQIFTKRGTTSRPRLTATLQSGFVQNNFSNALAPQHYYTAQASQTTGVISYNVGGSWTYMGQWSPASRTSIASGFGGARAQYGQLTADVNLRRSVGVNWQNGIPQQAGAEMVADGTATQGTAYPRRPVPATQTSNGQTLGGTLTYTLFSWWSHSATVGTDMTDAQNTRRMEEFGTPLDSMLQLSLRNYSRTNLAYSTTLRVPLSSIVMATVTGGADGFHYRSSNTSGSALSLANLSNVTVTRTAAHARGLYAQGQVGFWDAVFLTAGVRADYNPMYGVSVNPNVVPRYGIALTRDVETPWGPVTAKLRASYGHSTRPPTSAQTEFHSYCETYPADCSVYTGYYGEGVMYTMQNPYLLPEQQQGGEGGLELYFGSRGSLVITRYNQYVNDLIQLVVSYADSVRTLRPLSEYNPKRYTPDPDGYYYWVPSKYMNTVDLRNQGWEVQGTLNVGPLQARGTYSFTKSRILDLGAYAEIASALTTAFGPVYVKGGSFAGLPEHTYAFSFKYAHDGTSVGVNFQGQGQSIATPYYSTGSSGLSSALLCISSNRLANYKCALATGNTRRINFLNPRYLGGGDLSASQRLSDNVDAIVQIFNLRDAYRFDAGNTYATIGRQTKLGLRLRY